MTNDRLKENALEIISYAIKCADPYRRTLETLKTLSLSPDGRLAVFSIGKAAVPMAKAAEEVFGKKISFGMIVTKYGHAGTLSLDRFEVIEAAHPVSDENSVLAAEKALSIAETLNEKDTCLVLLSGGGSALFEKSSVSFETQKEITKKLLSRGAAIEEINSVRRRISLVKGGKFAEKAYPAKVITAALSDVLSNDKSAIASGITVSQPTSENETERVVQKYLPEYTELFSSLPKKEEGGKINDGGFFFVGDINSLCDAAEEKAKELGFSVLNPSRSLTGEARNEAKKILSSVTAEKGKRAYIFGGETTVTLTGNGLGGRNQEMALAAAIEISGKESLVFASAGSDGTDGPTDAAGGISDGKTFSKIKAAGLDPMKELENNNSYYALKAADSLIITGPTGTNVNDLSIVLTDF